MNARSSPQCVPTAPWEPKGFKTMSLTLGRDWVYFEAAGRTLSLKSETLGSSSGLLHLLAVWS